MLNEQKGIVQVHMLTAHDVDPATVDQVKAALRQKLGADVDIIPGTDPKLIGGVLVRVGDKVYDGSVARRLELLREQAVAETVRTMRDDGDKFAKES